MSEPSPAYLWYPKDALSSGRVSALSPLEELWYRRALDHAWLNDGLPSDPAEFAGWVGRGCTAESAVKIIEKFFVPHKKDASKVVMPRQEKERTNLRKKNKQKSDAGKLGMAKRWKQKSNGDNTVITERNIPIPIPIAIPKKEKEEEKKATTATISDDQWLDSLQSNPAYKLLQVRTEFSKATIWAETNKRQCTRRFFVNWLNRAKPMDTTKPNSNAYVGKETRTPEQLATFVPDPPCSICGKDICFSNHYNEVVATI